MVLNGNLTGLRARVTEILTRELDLRVFIYHNLRHARDVSASAFELGIKEKVTNYELNVLRAAGLLHDIGCIRGYEGHEEASSEIAIRLLPQFGYSKGFARDVADIIPTTKVPQEPSGHIEMILCDADLSGLGREEYFIRAEELRLERKRLGDNKPLLEWLKSNYDFLTGHSYFTGSAKQLYEAGKQRNIQEIYQALSRLDNDKCAVEPVISIRNRNA